MNISRSFDPAAEVYDQTRPFFEPIAKQGIRAVLDLIGEGAHLLDVGTGTGRISVPLLERGVHLIGCDLSRKMLRRLHEKSLSAPIAQSDAASLPFPAHHFDRVLTVHVMHLIGPWREALREFKRVLVPGGTYLNVRTWEAVGVSIRGRMRVYWRDWLLARGVDARLPGVQNEKEFLSELESLGASVTQVEVIRYPLAFTLREELGHFRSRASSETWLVPDEIHAESVEELGRWVEGEYGDLDQPREDQVRFAIDAARFDRSR